MNIGKQFKEGMITNNPVLVQLLGMCSTMAITTSFFNGLGMGVAVIIILTLSNVLISAMRKIIPDKIRIAMFIVVIAGFVTCVDLLLQAFVPALSESLGVFIPLIVVNCIILGRAEAFSYKNGIAASFFDGIFQGVGYTVVLVIMCVIRELLGSGTFGGGLLNGGQGIRIIPEQFGVKIMTLPVGGFLVLGVLIASLETDSGLWGAALGVAYLLSYDFLFTAPLFTLKVLSRTDVAALVIFLVVSLIMGVITHRMSRQVQAAERTACALGRLNRLSVGLLESSTPQAACSFAQEFLTRVLRRPVTITLGEPPVAGSAAARDCYERRSPTGYGEPGWRDATEKYLPLGMKGRLYGVVAIDCSSGDVDSGSLSLVNAVVAQTLVAVERNELAESEPDGAGVPAAISAPSNDKSAAEPIRPTALS